MATLSIENGIAKTIAFQIIYYMPVHKQFSVIVFIKLMSSFLLYQSGNAFWPRLVYYIIIGL